MLEEVLETTCSSSFFNAIDAEEIAFSQRAIFTTATNTSLDTSGGSGWLEVEEDAEIEGMLLLRVDDEELYLDAEGVFDGQTSSFSDEVYFSFTLGHTWCEDGTFIAATSATAMTHDLVLLGQLRQADPEESWSYYGNADIWAQVMDVELLQGSYDPNLTPEELSEELTLAAYGTMNRAW
jgi:hypothetical protein